MLWIKRTRLKQLNGIRFLVVRIVATKNTTRVLKWESRIDDSFIYINTTGLQTENPYAPKNKVPWTPSQTDMLAEDWVFAEQED